MSDQSLTYNKTPWVNDRTPLNAQNMNNIEAGIEQLTQKINGFSYDIQDAIDAVAQRLEDDINTNEDEISTIKTELARKNTITLDMSRGRIKIT